MLGKFQFQWKDSGSRSKYTDREFQKFSGITKGYNKERKMVLGRVRKNVLLHKEQEWRTNMGKAVVRNT